jgi:hypothetical protein
MCSHRLLPAQDRAFATLQKEILKIANIAKDQTAITKMAWFRGGMALALLNA